ncbi:right-handed parallel beta-helix repeat-containing protein [Psychrosphaera sp.]|nr:right-handed parallel beta-helix repeat-containing protein [Psychrosphaera sp.]
MIIRTLLLIFALLFAAYSSATCQIFPADNIWNVKITDAPVHTMSDRWLRAIGKGVKVHPDFGDGRYRGKDIGIPVNYTDSQTPRFPVKFRYDRESDHVEYPIPEFVKIEGGAYGTGDRHIISLDRDECKLYELFHAFRGEGGDWVAGSGAVFDLNSNDLRKLGWTSADAAGLPIYPFLVKYEEVQTGRIEHALRFTVKVTNRKYIWPATHFASRENNNNLPPMGMRLRLKNDIDISGFSPSAKVVAQALKEYGMILADNGGALYISGAPNDNWDNNKLRDLKQLTTEHFDVVDASYLMISADSAATSLSSYQKEQYLKEKQLQGNQSANELQNEPKKGPPKNKAKYVTQFFVSNSGDDYNDGTDGSPWKTLQHAANMAAPGDYINVKKGTYKPFTIRNSGEENKAITFYADRAVIEGYAGSNRDGIAIKKANHIRISGFVVKNAKRAGVSATSCSDVQIEWNEVVDSGVWGIFTGFCSNLTIRHNSTSKSKKEHGIYVSNTSKNIKIYNNKSFLNHGAGIHLNGDESMGGEGLIKNAEIYNNYVHHNGKRGGSAINLDGVQYSTVYNNILYDNHATGIALFQGDGSDGSSNNQIVHNTIVMPKTGRWCVLFKSYSVNNTFKNNVCVSEHAYRGAISIDDTSLTGFQSDYNAFTPRFTLDGGESVLSFNEWQAFSNNDANSIVIENIDTLFDYAYRLFKPYSNSPLINKGARLVGFDYDFKKEKRSQSPDIGALNH